jgi:hypothetical protein
MPSVMGRVMRHVGRADGQLCKGYADCHDIRCAIANPNTRLMHLLWCMEPIFEADFQPGSFGYRPKKTAHEAVDRVAQAIVWYKTRVIVSQRLVWIAMSSCSMLALRSCAPVPLLPPRPEMTFWAIDSHTNKKEYNYFYSCTCNGGRRGSGGSRGANGENAGELTEALSSDAFRNRSPLK